jgi:phosphate transport system protein
MHLDKELENLNIMLLKMADVVQRNIMESFTLYKDKKFASGLTINDDIVDQYERLVEEICLNIILKERPYAKDLRKVTGILKMVADLERIGDHAEDIFEFNNKLQKYEKVKVQQIEDMVTTALSMVNDSILSFIKEDVNLAEEVIKRDDIIDKTYEDLISYLIEENKQGKISSAFAIYTSLVIKYIERIADHAVNIAEWVVYIINGFHKDRRIF